MVSAAEVRNSSSPSPSPSPSSSTSTTSTSTSTSSSASSTSSFFRRSGSSKELKKARSFSATSGNNGNNKGGNNNNGVGSGGENGTRSPVPCRYRAATISSTARRSPSPLPTTPKASSPPPTSPRTPGTLPPPSQVKKLSAADSRSISTERPRRNPQQISACPPPKKEPVVVAKAASAAGWKSPSPARPKRSSGRSISPDLSTIVKGQGAVLSRQNSDPFLGGFRRQSSLGRVSAMLSFSSNKSTAATATATATAPATNPEEHKECSAAVDAESLSPASDSDNSSNSSSTATSTPTRGGGIAVPSRFFQDMVSRLRGDRMRTSSAKVRDCSKPAPPSNNSSPGPCSPRFPSPISPHTLSSSSPCSPLSNTGSTRHAASLSSPLRGGGGGNNPSPTRLRISSQQTPAALNVSLFGRSNSLASLLSYGMDARKGRKALSSQLEEAHSLRILHNRWLQWRLVNTCANAAQSAQIANSERALYNVRECISQLRVSVAEKQKQMQEARHHLKLDAVLSSQVPCLDNWGSVKVEHSSSVQCLSEALDAANISLPVLSGAKVDIEALKAAFESAMDLMQAIHTSIEKRLPMAEMADSVMAEVAKTILQERQYLEVYAELLVYATSLQAEECSLRTHLIQLEKLEKRHPPPP